MKKFKNIMTRLADETEYKGNGRFFMNKTISEYISKIINLLAILLLSSHFVNGQKVSDFEFWINNATYNHGEQCYNYIFQNKNVCTIEKLNNFFSKRTDIVLTDYSTYVYEDVYSQVGLKKYKVTYVYVNKFSFRRIEWKRVGNHNKKDIFVKSMEAAVENGNKGLHTAYISKKTDKQKITNWFSNNSEFSMITGDNTDKYYKITFVPEEGKEQILAEMKKEEAFRSASNLEQMMATRKQYPDYRIPNPVGEIAGRLACRCYNNPDLGFMGSYTKRHQTETKPTSFETFLSVFPEYKDNTEFKREFLKFLEFNLDYNPAERFRKFMELFDDKDFALDFALKSESHKKIATLWCGLKLSEIFEVFGENDELFMRLITTRMDAASAEDIRKYLQQTNDYKTIEEFVYNDYLYTKDNIFRTWRSWLNMYKQLRPYLEDHIDITRLDECHDYVVKILNARAAAFAEIMRQGRIAICNQCVIDVSETKLPHTEEEWRLITTVTVQKPGKIVMENGAKYDFYRNDKGKWCLRNDWLNNKSFDKGTDMLKYFINECKRVHCVD
jgi:hypothetical protein